MSLHVVADVPGPGQTGSVFVWTVMPAPGPIGALTVGATADGLALVAFGDQPAAAAQAAELAGRALQMAMQAYRAGATTDIEVLDAERRARDAETGVDEQADAGAHRQQPDEQLDGPRPQGRAMPGAADASGQLADRLGGAEDDREGGGEETEHVYR